MSDVHRASDCMSKTSTAKRQSPLYRQVFIELRHRIERGQIAIGMPVPSEAELSEMFAARRITVRHSLRLLEADGYIRKEPARRTVVVSSKPALRDAWVFESLEDIAHQVLNTPPAVDAKPAKMLNRFGRFCL